MDDFHTPNVKKSLEFSFNRSPSIVNRIPDLNRIQEAQKLDVSKINLRCFTPTVDDFRSPGLSPIFAMAAISPVTPKPKDDFKKPDSMLKKKNRYNPSPTYQQEQDSLTPESSIQLSTSLNTENGSSGSETKNSNLYNMSKSYSFLNQTLNVKSLLKNVGLEKYDELFDDIDLEKFLDLKEKDLQGMGLQSDEHCTIIIDLLKELNTL